MKRKARAKFLIGRLDRSLLKRENSKLAQLSQLEALLKLQQVNESSMENWESSKEEKEIHISEISPIEEEGGGEEKSRSDGERKKEESMREGGRREEGRWRKGRKDMVERWEGRGGRKEENSDGIIDWWEESENKRGSTKIIQ